MTAKEKLEIEAAELENKARLLRLEALALSQKMAINAEKKFKKRINMDVYTSDDYCGLDVGKLHFYFGYEETVCKRHKTQKICEERDCEQKEDAFVVTEGDKELMRMGRSKLWPKDDEEPFWYLIAGIGHYLKKFGPI